MRPRWKRRGEATLLSKTPKAVMTAVVVSALATTAGCGSTADLGGFTRGDRAAAQSALDTLQQTSIPTTLVVLTNTAGTVPTVCRVHLESVRPRTFALFVFWRPSKRAVGGTYTWFRATILDHVRQDTFHTGYVSRRAGEASVLKSHRGDAFAKPSEPCEILMNGYLRLLAETR
jgi:hypothetical protein